MKSIASVYSNSQPVKSHDGFILPVVFVTHEGQEAAYDLYLPRKKDSAARLSTYQDYARLGRLNAQLSNGRVIATHTR